MCVSKNVEIRIGNCREWRRYECRKRRLHLYVTWSAASAVLLVGPLKLVNATLLQLSETHFGGTASGSEPVGGRCLPGFTARFQQAGCVPLPAALLRSLEGRLKPARFPLWSIRRYRATATLYAVWVKAD